MMIENTRINAHDKYVCKSLLRSLCPGPHCPHSQYLNSILNVCIYIIRTLIIIIILVIWHAATKQRNYVGFVWRKWKKWKTHKHIRMCSRIFRHSVFVRVVYIRRYYVLFMFFAVVCCFFWARYAFECAVAMVVVLVLAITIFMSSGYWQQASLSTERCESPLPRIHSQFSDEVHKSKLSFK